MKTQYNPYIRVLILSVLLVGTGAVASEPPKGKAATASNDVGSLVAPGQIAPRLQNLGKYAFPVTTDSARAQLFINQGMMLAYGFNHAEAARSFQEAARLDANCAMAYWGMALVLGPNINMPMPKEVEPRAYALIQKAVNLKHLVSQKEQAYIDALATRYSADGKIPREELDATYAESIHELHERYPDDLDAAALYAEALMDLRPWNYWTRDMKPYPETGIVIETLEKVLSKNPDHPLALHLYIHAVELAKPQLAETAAERLWTLAPGAGHLVHMPSHIFRRVGRYADASKSNGDAIAADEDYIAQCRAQGVYPLAYYPHNIHFLWDSATMEGRSHVAMDAARKAAAKIPDGAWRDIPMLHQFLVAPVFAAVRFGKWDMILQEPKPPKDSLFWTGVWRYARGTAFAAIGKTDEAKQELKSLERIAANQSLADYRVTFSRNGAKPILEIAAEVLTGEIAAQSGDFDQAVAHLHRSVLLEDNLIYNEPPDWHIPTRQTLGTILLKAGRAREAEAIYWQDLRLNPENGWSLFGLKESLRAQGKIDEADVVEKRFNRAWKNADIVIASYNNIGIASYEKSKKDPKVSLMPDP